MPGVTIFEQPEPGYKKKARVRVYEEARRILVWGRKINYFYKMQILNKLIKSSYN